MRVSNCLRYITAVALVWAMGNLPRPATANDAEDSKPAAAGADAAPSHTGTGKPPAKDPTASAFALPKGTTLNAKQQAAFDQLKADKEPELRQAIDDLQNSKTGATAAAAKKIRDLRNSIRQKINDIMYGKLAASGGSGNDSSSASSNGYSVPYDGYPAPYYSGYWPYGYYPYPYYSPRWRGSRSKNSSGNSNGKTPPSNTSPAPRPAAGSSAGGKR
jgi:hypothetical protein